LTFKKPFGFHLADGVLYTYLQGNEYEDIAAAWNWDLIPGITTDYGNTPLDCGNTKRLGIEAFVGGASNGQVGIAAMRYTNPFTRALHWQKAWFFLDDNVQHIMISALSSTSGAPVLSVLDQRRLSGPVFVDGTEQQSSRHPAAQSLWHGGVGYQFPETGAPVSVQIGQKTGDWSNIGTSTQPPTTVDLFSAWITHESPDQPTSYTTFPGTTADSFATKKRELRLRTIQNDAHVSAVFDEAHNTFMAVFWDARGGSVVLPAGDMLDPVKIATNGHAAVIYHLQAGNITVSDPSQHLSSVKVAITKQGATRILTFALPRGGLAGSSVTKNAQS
jgi:hypothetical protein